MLSTLMLRCRRPRSATGIYVINKLLIYLFAVFAVADLSADQANEQRPASPLVVISTDATHHFMVEIASTPQDRAVGLMYRDRLADDRGMLFTYKSAERRSFWMKNTLIPLDIIFIDTNAKVINIIAMATPGSLAPLPSTSPAIAVLEIRGGLAAEIGIEPGDEIQHDFFSKLRR